MSSWNVENNSGTNASELNYIPLEFNPPAIQNNDVLVYSSTLDAFVAEPLTSAGGITSVTSVGTQSLVYGLSAGDAQLKGVTGDGVNTIATTVNSGTQVQVQINPNLTINSITPTGSYIALDGPTQINGEVASSSVGIDVNANASSGSDAYVALGSVNTNEGFVFDYVVGSNTLTLSPLGGSAPGTFNVDLTGGQTNIFGNITTHAPLTTAGALYLDGAVYDTTTSEGFNGQVLTTRGSTGSGLVDWVYPTLGSVTDLGSGAPVYAGLAGTSITLRGIKGDPNITVTYDADDIFVSLNSSVTVPDVSVQTLLTVENGLADHTNATGTVGQFLSATGSGAQTLWATPLLSGLGDVLVSSPTNGQNLVWNSGASKWENTNSVSTTTIYSGDGTLAGNRNVYLNTNSLTFDGPGSILIPTAMVAQYAQLGTIVADSTGKLALYVNGWDWTSINSTIYTTSLNYPTLNAMNFCTITHPGNANFIGDCYFSLDGTGYSTIMQWKINANGSVSDTGWNNFQLVTCNLSNPNTGQQTFALQGRIGHLAYNILEIRLIQTGGSGTITYNGNLRLLMRGDDNSFITSTLVSQTPYLDSSINLDLQLQNVYNSKSFTFAGQDFTTMGSQNFYWVPGQKIWLSASISFNFLTIGANTLAFDFYINGNLLSYAMGSKYGSGGDVNLSVSNLDLFAGALYMAGELVSGTNTISIGVSITGGTVTSSGMGYSVGLICAF